MSPRKSDQELDAWDDLAQGGLSREEEAVLRALADEGEDAAVHYEAFAALDDDFRARTATKLEAQLTAAKHRRQRRYFAGATGVVLAAAAAVLLFAVPEGSKLAPYTLEARGGVSAVRGGTTDAGPLSYDSQSKLILIAKPPARVDGSVVASLALIVDGRPESIPAQLTIAQSGAVRAEVLGADLPRRGADLSLLLLVEREAHTPEELLRLKGAGDPRVLIVTVVPTSAQ